MSANENSSTCDISGCERCSGSDPALVWAERPFELVSELVYESHFMVSVLECKLCTQKWLSIFTELIDWNDGDDDQSSWLMPLRPEEAAELISAGAQVSTTRITEIGSGRRSLYIARPTGQEQRISWSHGLFIGPHD